MAITKRSLIAMATAIFATSLTQCGGPGSATFCVGLCGSAAQGPEFLYITSSSHGGEVLSFPIDRNTGALGPFVSISGPKAASGIASSQNHFLYAADTADSVIHGFVIDQSSGSLTRIPGSPFLSVNQSLSSPPLWLVAGPAVYTTSENGTSGYTIGSNGALTLVVGSPYSGGFGGQAVLAQTNTTPSHTFLYATNSLDPNGKISAFQLVAPETGILTPVPGDFVAGASSEPGAIVFDGAFPTPLVFVALGGSRQIAAFSVDSTTGALAPVSGSPFAVGFRPSSLALNAEQKYLYALDPKEGKIFVYLIDKSGVLFPRATSTTTVGANPASIAITAEDYLYITLPDSNLIEGFTINSDTGAIAPMPASPFAALEPRLVSAVQIPSL